MFTMQHIIFKENIRLKKCDLSWNGFGHIGGIAIGDALMTNETLEYLDISGNRLGLNNDSII